MDISAALYCLELQLKPIHYTMPMLLLESATDNTWSKYCLFFLLFLKHNKMSGMLSSGMEI